MHLARTGCDFLNRTKLFPCTPEPSRTPLETNQRRFRPLARSVMSQYPLERKPYRHPGGGGIPTPSTSHLSRLEPRAPSPAGPESAGRSAILAWRQESTTQSPIDPDAPPLPAPLSPDRPPSPAMRTDSFYSTRSSPDPSRESTGLPSVDGLRFPSPPKGNIIRRASPPVETPIAGPSSFKFPERPLPPLDYRSQDSWAELPEHITVTDRDSPPPIISPKKRERKSSILILLHKVRTVSRRRSRRQTPTQKQKQKQRWDHITS